MGVKQTTAWCASSDRPAPVLVQGAGDSAPGVIVRGVPWNPVDWLAWRKPEGLTLDRDYEREIMRTAFLGRRADEPETAWFVAHHARDRLRLTWLYGSSIMFFAALILLSIVSGSSKWWSQLIAVAIILGNVWFLYAYRRALRLNEPIATVPPGLEGRGKGNATPTRGGPSRPHACASADQTDIPRV